MQLKSMQEMSFAQKLQEIIQNKQFFNIIRITDSGHQILILNDSLLETEVLPMFYRHSNVQSFKRQMNLYGFKRAKKGSITKYIHPLLKQGKKLKDLKNKHQILRNKKRMQENQQIYGKNALKQEQSKFSDQEFSQNNSQIQQNNQINSMQNQHIMSNQIMNGQNNFYEYSSELVYLCDFQTWNLYYTNLPSLTNWSYINLI